MIESNIKSPGVYINEINAFPNSVTPIATPLPDIITNENDESKEANNEPTPKINLANDQDDSADSNAATSVGETLPTIASEIWNNKEYYIQDPKYNDLNKFKGLDDNDELVFPEIQSE